MIRRLIFLSFLSVVSATGGARAQDNIPVLSSLASVQPNYDYPPDRRQDLGLSREDERILRRVCLAIRDNLYTDDSNQDYTYEFEARILGAAGVLPTDPPASVRLKMKGLLEEWYPAERKGASCYPALSIYGLSGQGLPIPHYAALEGSMDFLRRYARDWQLPVNIVSSTGQTTLDLVAAEYVRNRSNQSRATELSRAYSMLRQAGAKHRTELEQEGQVETSEQQLSGYGSQLEASAESGNLADMFEVANRYARGVGFRRDITTARRWAERAERLAIETSHWGSIHQIADYYVHGHLAEFPSNPTRAAALYRRMIDLGAPAGESLSEMGVSNVAKLQLARLYRDGNGVPKNLQESIRLYHEAASIYDMSTISEQAVKEVTVLLESLGRIEEAASYLRMINNDNGFWTFDGRRNPRQFFLQYGLSHCGRRFDGSIRTECDASAYRTAPGRN